MIFMEEKYCWVCGARLYEIATQNIRTKKVGRPRKGVSIEIKDEGYMCSSHAELVENSAYYWADPQKLYRECILNYYRCGKSLQESLQKLRKVKVA